MPAIPELGRIRQEDCEFETSLGYIVRPVSKTTATKKHTILSMTIKI
jgi:hypothetical protein